MANDKYDAFAQAIIILLLDSLLVCIQVAAATTMHAAFDGGEKGEGEGEETRRAPVREI